MNSQLFVNTFEIINWHFYICNTDDMYDCSSKFVNYWYPNYS